MTIDFEDEMKKSVKKLNNVLDTEKTSIEKPKKEWRDWKVALLMFFLSLGFLLLGVLVIALIGDG